MRPIAANSNKSPHSLNSPNTVGEIVSARHNLSFFEYDYLKVILPLLQESDMPAAGVLDEHGQLSGLLTERCILRHIFARSTDKLTHASNVKKYLDDMLVADAMIHAPEALDDDMPIEEATGLMLRRGYRFMPVVSRYDRRRLLGIVGERELAAHLQKQVEHLKKSEKTQQSILAYMLREPYGGGTPQYENSA